MNTAAVSFVKTMQRTSTEMVKIMIKSLLRVGGVLALSGVLAGSVSGRADMSPSATKEMLSDMASVAPAHCIAGHRVGQMVLAVNNNGTFGTGFRAAQQDCFTGESVPSCEYPKGSHVEYLFAGAFWIGAVIGRDTVCTVGADGWSFVREFFPDELPFGRMVYRSIIDPGTPEFQDAISEEDYISVYTDTFTEGIDPDAFGRPHHPLFVEVTESSYAWSYAYAEDFVLFDYQIKNIGSNLLENVYMGIYVDADVCYDCTGTSGYIDDLCGFLHTYLSTYGSCQYVETVNIAWIADNDGDHNAQIPAPNVTATRIIRTPSDSLDVAFNWWISNPADNRDFGPRHRSPWRDFGTGGLGTPEGDVNKYYIMSNGEFDYDQAYTAYITPNDSLWLYPSQEAAGSFSTGFDTRYLLSFGPFDIRPNQTLPISFAYVAGADLHSRDHLDNLDNLPGNPDEYYANLDFSDLATNATWASWIYDNPGVDTDHNGYRGKSHICCTDSIVREVDTTINGEDTIIIEIKYTACDTFWYEGDGVPDFRGAAPPPAPDFWVESSVGGLKIRFNGLRSETTRDVFSRLIDFEGYRVYVGRDIRNESFSLVASYDRKDYNKYVFDPSARTPSGWVIRDIPYTLEQLRCLYGESCDDTTFHPLDYAMFDPYQHPEFPESTFYFAKQDNNTTELGVDTPIRKIYPDQPYPSSLIPDSSRAEELTEDGYLKYFEYEVVIDGLLPTVEWYVNVTAFDYGSPESGLSALETSKTVGVDSAFALSGWVEVQQENLDVFVYPNPYRIDGDYGERGFEGRNPLIIRPPDRTRVIHFANLPPKCMIRIYTLDGDLVRELVHDKSPSDPQASHDEWNMITRNTQMVVSGLYYWTVEDEDGRIQTGKLAIIM